jgi:uncharacterized membrane protein
MAKASKILSTPSSPPSSAASDPLPAHIEQTLAAIARLHDRHHRSASPLQRAVEAVTALVGRAVFAGALVAVMLVWIGANLILAARGAKPFDPPPFEALQAVAEFLALFLAVFILATQRRENMLVDLRLQLMLELALVSEHRSAKTIALLEELRVDLPSVPNRSDPEADAMASPADPEVMLEALFDKIIEPSPTDNEVSADVQN